MSRIISKLKAYFSDSYMLILAFSLSYPTLCMIFILKKYIYSPSHTFLYVFLVLLSFYILRGIKNIAAYIILIIECIFIGIIFIHWLDYIQFILPSLFRMSEFLYSFFNIGDFVILIEETVYFILSPYGVIENPFLFEVFLLLIIPGLFYYLIFNRKSPFYLLILSVIYIYAWGLYYDDSSNYVLYYVIGLLLYTYEYYHQKQLEVFKQSERSSEHYKFNHLRLTYLILGLLIFSISQLLIAFFPLNTINSAVSKYIPDTGILRSAYIKQKSYGYYTLEDTMYYPLDNRLGGSITQESDDLFFLVDYDGEEDYLRGRVKNQYTGERWINQNTRYNNDKSFTTRAPLKKMDIELVNLETISLFSPYKYIKSNFKSEFVYSNADSILIYKGPKSLALAKGYSVYYDPLYQEELNAFEKRKYLKLPTSDLSYTKNLTQSIVNSIDNDYDKIMALQSYLRENEEFTYSLKVNETNTEGLYEITESRAHAWVEAYIEGEGWIILEATPIYSLSDNEVVDEGSTDESFDDALDINSQGNFEINSEKNLDMEGNIAVEEIPERNNKTLLFGGLIFIFFLGIIILILFRRYHRKLRDYEKLDYNAKGHVLIRRLEYLIILKGIKKANNEFLYEYFVDSLKDLGIDLDQNVKEVFLGYFFDSKGLDEESVEVLEGLITDFFNEQYGDKNIVTRSYYHWQMIRN